VSSGHHARPRPGDQKWSGIVTRGPDDGCGSCATLLGADMTLCIVARSALEASIRLLASAPLTACGGTGTTLPSMICEPGLSLGLSGPCGARMLLGRSDCSSGPTM